MSLRYSRLKNVSGGKSPDLGLFAHNYYFWVNNLWALNTSHIPNNMNYGQFPGIRGKCSRKHGTALYYFRCYFPVTICLIFITKNYCLISKIQCLIAPVFIGICITLVPIITSSVTGINMIIFFENVMPCNCCQKLGKQVTKSSLFLR